MKRRILRGLFAAALAGGLLASCGGGGGGDSSGGTPPAGTPPSPPVDGPAWTNFGANAQHSAVGAVATQNLATIRWQTPVDLAPPYRPNGALLAHYASPVITSHNTVLLPVKTGANGGFRVEARAGGNGVLIWSETTDYVLPPHNWVPSYNIALNGANRVYAPGAGGKLLYRDNADSASATGWQTLVFYGGSAYNSAPATYDARVYINTPLTVDAQGNVYFGFIVTAANPIGLASGIARIGADGSSSWVSAATAAADATIAKVAMNSAPALSNDGQTVYVVVNAALGTSVVQSGYLLALNSQTLALQRRAALIDPRAATPARISDDGTSSPLVGPDGDVYIGVLEATFGTHNARGWLLHFDATLATNKVPGSFGWDNTPSIVPAAMVSSYSGGSTYLLLSKYNNYAGAGNGDGVNSVAILDPNATQLDTLGGGATVTVMKEVLKKAGITADPAGGAGAVKEWCINTAAVDPASKSVLMNSEDGYLYRWDLSTDQFTQRIQMNNGVGQSYTPTAIGADGAVYAVNNATLFSVGR